ncbi:MAG TPA: hypothetical protein VNG31_07830 [Candidatus Baltobacteraceae bacterium]|nr:hypothetical protein [Candidatus Baltobacteraceae bacterium]
MLLRWALACCALPLALAPLLVPFSSQAQGSGIASTSGPAVPALPQAEHAPRIDVRKDPFVPDEPGPVEEAGVDGEVTPLPPNSAAADLFAYVQAVVLGATPKALVTEDGKSHVVGIGSRLAGSTVKGIDARAVWLEDGRKLPVLQRKP